MGWWKVQGTEDVIGDAPLDALTNAVADVLAQYEESFGRKPTVAEWEALLHAVLGAEEAKMAALADGHIVAVTLDVAPDE